MKNIEKADFDQRLECPAAKCWLKYTTVPSKIFVDIANVEKSTVFNQLFDWLFLEQARCVKTAESVKI